MMLRNLPAVRRPLPLAAVTATAPRWDEAEVADVLDDGSFRLADGRRARQAASCLLRPEVGDTVVMLHSASGLFITAVLLRAAAADATARLSVPGAHTLALEQTRIELTAHHRLGLHCLGDVELSSATARYRSTHSTCWPRWPRPSCTARGIW